MEADLRQVVQEMIDALNAGELERSYEPVSHLCVHVSPMGTLRGREAVMAAEIPLLQQMSSHWRRIERLLVSGNDVVSWLTFGGTVAATGKSFETEVCNVQTFHDGKIVEWHAYGDYGPALEAWQ